MRTGSAQSDSSGFAESADSSTANAEVIKVSRPPPPHPPPAPTPHPLNVSQMFIDHRFYSAQ